MSETSKAWVWLIGIALIWLGIVYPAAEVEWSVEVMFAASLAAYTVLRLVSRNWGGARAIETTERGRSLFGKLTVITIPFAILSMLVRWKLDSELLDWTVGRVLWLQSTAAYFHAERRWAYLLSAVGFGFALYAIYAYVRREYDSFDRASETKKRITSFLNAVGAVFLALATFSIVVGPATVSLAKMSERQASRTLTKVADAIRSSDIAWRVLVGQYLAAEFETIPVEIDLPADSVPDQLCSGGASDLSDCTLGDALDTIIASEADAYILDTLIGPAAGPLPWGGNGNDPSPMPSAPGGGKRTSIAFGLYSAATRSARVYVSSASTAPTSFELNSDLFVGEVLDRTKRFCEMARCKPAALSSASSQAISPVETVTATRFGKVLGALFDAILPMAGLSIPAPQVGEGTASAFQDAIDAVTKDPLKAKLRELFTKGTQFIVKYCTEESQCEISTPLRSELESAVRETPGWRDRLSTAISARWPQKNSPPPTVVDLIDDRPIIDDQDPVGNCFCEDGRFLGRMRQSQCRPGQRC